MCMPMTISPFASLPSFCFGLSGEKLVSYENGAAQSPNPGRRGTGCLEAIFLGVMSTGGTGFDSWVAQVDERFEVESPLHRVSPGHV